LEQVHLSREQVVDQLVVGRTASRRAYMDALVQFAGAGDAARPAIAFLRHRHLASRLRQLSKEPHMTRLRLAGAAGALLLVLAGTAATVLSAMPLDLPALGVQAGATTLEVRLAELQPGPGLREAVLDGSNRRIYMRPDAIVGTADVASASVVEAGGRYSVNVTFVATASDRLAEATKIHIGRPLAIVLDGRVIAAPTLRSTIRGAAVISGDFTRSQAERIAAGLRPPAAAAAPAGQAHRISEPGVSLPAVVTEVKPHYTQAAMDAKIQGNVELSVVVRADGSVGDVMVKQPLDAVHGLDDAAVEAARQWTFKPGTKDGKAVDVEVTLSFKFTLA
jgi:TonB family protein